MRRVRNSCTPVPWMREHPTIAVKRQSVLTVLGVFYAEIMTNCSSSSS